MTENEEICKYCHSYSGPQKGAGWCMKLRKSTKHSNVCGLFN